MSELKKEKNRLSKLAHCFRGTPDHPAHSSHKEVAQKLQSTPPRKLTGPNGLKRPQSTTFTWLTNILMANLLTSPMLEYLTFRL